MKKLLNIKSTSTIVISICVIAGLLITKDANCLLAFIFLYFL